MNRLLRLGFIPVGNWVIDSESNVQCVLTSNQETKNILYSFVCNGDIKYIGKTVNSLYKRMYGYQNPKATQNTNIRVNALIRQTLEADLPVDIFIFADNGLLSYGGYRINIASGLEDTLIYEINPQWNYSGRNKLTEDKESDDSQKDTEQKIDSIVEPVSFENFVIQLGQTYFNQGFFNVPVEYSNSLAGNNSKIEIKINNTEQPIQGYINRLANKNGTPRIMGGIELKQWIQTNFKQDDKMKVQILSPVSIELLKP